MSGRIRAGIISLPLAAAMFTAIIVVSIIVVSGARAESAPDIRTTTVTAERAVPQSCFERLRSGGAVDRATLAAPQLGYLAAALEAPSGDWDLGIFDARSGESLGGSASAGPEELAQAFVLEGQKLIVQACRASGDASEASLSLGIEPIDPDGAVRQSLVRVTTPTSRDKDRLQALGLDLTHSAGRDFIDVLLHGGADRSRLAAAGFDSEVLIGDMARQGAIDRRADARFAAEAETSALPSGRTSYRLLADYQQELKDLAADNPDLVRPITLNNETYEGRPVEGIEITTDPNRVRDGKPVFLQMGIHHAREWPSGEHAMEWAYELIEGYRDDDPEFRRLVRQTRTIIVPVINPDGFNASRNAGELNGNGGGANGDTLVQFATAPDEYRRKNCRVGDSETALCTGSVGAAENGVDPNRNYGGFWGGPGASDSPEAADYRGPEPFSEPETQNVRELVSERAVVTLITNHTFSNLVLRPPGVAVLGDSVDEPLYRAFGADMTAENGYLNQKGFELYDTTGTTEDFTYTATGGLGFTFEIGCNQGDDGASFDPEAECIGNFHPPFEQVVAEYEGNGPAAQNVGGGGNRGAYLVAQRSTADERRHSVLTGNAPAGAVLRVEKDIQVPTWEGYSEGVDNPGPAFLDDTLVSEMTVRGDGKFEFNVNPSTSPLAAQDTGRPQDGGPPQATIEFSGDNTTTTPPAGCAGFETEDPNCWNDHPFEIDAVSDNEAATVALEWPSPLNDWDVKVFRDTDGDGTSVGEPASAEVGQSAQGPSAEESTTFVDPETASGKLQPGKYVVRVINFAGTDPATGGYDGTVSFLGPEPFEAGTTESWTFTCSTDGQVRFSKQITVDRGESVKLDLADKCAARGDDGGGGGGVAANCDRDGANIIRGTKKADRLRGTRDDDAILARKGRDRVSAAGGNDCVVGQKGGDQLRGNGGNDALRGGKGRDKLSGGGGDDLLKGGGGADRLRGGAGKDTLKGGKGPDVLKGGGGKDVLKCGRGKDVVVGAGKRDRIAKSCEVIRPERKG